MPHHFYQKLFYFAGEESHLLRHTLYVMRHIITVFSLAHWRILSILASSSFCVAFQEVFNTQRSMWRTVNDKKRRKQVTTTQKNTCYSSCFIFLLPIAVILVALLIHFPIKKIFLGYFKCAFLFTVL